MALHIFKGSGAPSFTPAGVGHHYIDTDAKVSYISVGTSSAADWETSDATAAIAAHVAASDPHSQYLTETEADSLYDVIGAASASQSFAVNRANHTGTQAASTISDFQTAARTAVVQDSISDAITDVAPSQNAVFDALALKANTSHTHALSDLTQSGASTGQVVSWNGTAWVPVNAPSSAVWGGITGTLSAQTDLQGALDGKQPNVSGTNDRMVYKDGSGVVKSLEALSVNAKNGLSQSLEDTFADNEPHPINTEFFELIPSEDAPGTVINVHNLETVIDPDNSGFGFGSAGNALNLFSNFIRAEGTGDVGVVAFFNNSFVIGDGSNPFDFRGVSYAYGFGEIKSGINITGPMQGYGFQPIVRTGATVDTASYTQAFYDSMNYEVPSSYHTSFNSSVSIDTIVSTKNLTGFAFTPDISQVDSGGSVTGVNVSGQYGNFDGSSSWVGVDINPNISNSQYAAGLQVTMDNVTPYAGVSASLTMQDLTFTFNQPQAFNNSFTVEFTSGGTAGSEVVSVSGFAITIQIESGVSTATQIKAACDASPGFAANITTSISGVGSNAQVADGPDNFSGGVDAGRKVAAFLDGDVEITGGLTFGGALSIGKISAFASQAMVNGGGQPGSVHSLISSPTVDDNVTLTTGDTIAVNTAALINIGTNSSVSTAFIGVAALGLPAVLTMGSGSTLDRCYGALFALSLDVSAAGGTVDEVGLCRSVAIPNGVTTVNNLYGYLFDLPFGDPGTDTWGFYDRPGKNNYFAGTLLIGGVAGSDDKVTNSSVAFEVKSTTKAMVLPRMTTTERNALTAIAGMMIFNTTTSALEVYDGGTWV